MSKVPIEFGALAPKLARQLSEQHHMFDAGIIKHCQQDADVLTRLRVRGYLSERTVETIQRRLIRKIMRELKSGDRQ